MVLKKCRSQVFVQGSANMFFFSLFFPGAFAASPSLISVSSYGVRGGLTSRRPGHISGTEMAGGPCVSCSGV